MALTALSGIFNGMTDAQAGGGTTSSAGDLVIPSGKIVSFVPEDKESSASEFVFGMCETMHSAVKDGGLINCTSAVATSLSGGNTLKKVYTFSVNLDFTDANLENLNVKAES